MVVVVVVSSGPISVETVSSVRAVELGTACKMASIWVVHVSTALIHGPVRVSMGAITHLERKYGP